MATSDKEQKSIYVRMDKRIAMGEKLTGTSLQGKSTNQISKPKGGLSSLKKK
jgi:hypothetical protein